MQVFLTLVLMLTSCLTLLAQQATPLAIYTDASGRYQLSYPRTWQLKARGTEATFSAGSSRVPGAEVAFSMLPLPDGQQDSRLLAGARPDSVIRRIRQLPKVHLLRFNQQEATDYDELHYDYTYVPATPGADRIHVYGRQLWRAGYEFRIEYRSLVQYDGRDLAEGRNLVDSFIFTAKPLPSRRYADQQCDDKMYGIAALRIHNGVWEDDCRTIHEFSTSHPSAAPVVHRQVLPFQSYALAKGFDNCLYSVTKAPTNAPELVYRYDPATREGHYTTWQLPAQGPETVWISGATDEHGDLYFLTSDGQQLVKVSPYTGRVSPVWTTDPVRLAPYYLEIGFASAGTHGNFCFDDTHNMYLVYSTDGSLLRVNMQTRRPAPERMQLTGLPTRGGYSDLLMQNDAAGRRRMYMAGPHALYEVDLERHQATRVRSGTYTDLAGCNLFRATTPRPTAPPPPPITATWQGRVLDATTGRPLPQAQLRLNRSEVVTAVLLSPQANFSYTAVPGRTYQYHVELAGYFPSDSSWQATPGPLERDILLRPLTVGATQQLATVQFEQGQATLLPTSYAALTRLTDLLIDNPRMTIELRGHTDNVGPGEKNVILSQQRVATVKTYLIAHGVAPVRVSGEGFGGSQPIASNDEESTRRLNRRVEFRITGL